MFVWDVLVAIGFDPFLINQIKGLMVDATSKVHVIGLFTNEIDL